jgi:hypothetical protein
MTATPQWTTGQRNSVFGSGPSNTRPRSSKFAVGDIMACIEMPWTSRQKRWIGTDRMIADAPLAPKAISVACLASWTTKPHCRLLLHGQRLSGVRPGLHQLVQAPQQRLGRRDPVGRLGELDLGRRVLRLVLPRGVGDRPARDPVEEHPPAHRESRRRGEPARKTSFAVDVKLPVPAAAMACQSSATVNSLIGTTANTGRGGSSPCRSRAVATFQSASRLPVLNRQLPLSR